MGSLPEQGKVDMMSGIYDVIVVGAGPGSLHFWTANLVVVMAVLHLARVFTTGSYKRPQKANWLVGIGLLASAGLGLALVRVRQ